MPNSKQIVYLSQAQYAELIANGSITVDGVTVTYDENDIYVTPQAEPVTDVRVNGTSITANGVANVPIAGTDALGVVKIAQANALYGIQIDANGTLQIQTASGNRLKNGSAVYVPITPSVQHTSVYYGLAKAAGADMKNLSGENIGVYPDEQKSAIQQMLGVSDLLAPRETSYIASQAYAVGDIFTLNGKLYKVTTAISESGAIVVQDDGETVSGANAVQCKLGEETIKDVQINGTSILQDGVANVPVAGNGTYQTSTLGVVKGGQGVKVATGGLLFTDYASASDIKTGTNYYKPFTPVNQGAAAFYGLAKAAGDTTQSQSNNEIGTYTDGAKASIQHMLGTDTIIAPNETDPFTSAHSIGELFTMNGKLYRAKTAIAAADAVNVGTNCEEVSIAGATVRDVILNNASKVTNGVVNLIISNGLKIVNNSIIGTDAASTAYCKNGTDNARPIVPLYQKDSVFYGLAKASGDTTQSASSNAVGTYTDNAKASIKSMLGIVDGSTSTVSVTGTTPSITAVENTRYTCGEVSTLTITPPASGICIVRFTSGSTPTVLTATGVVWPAWFDATDLEADTTYEICITDGYGAVMSWAL